MGIIHIGREGRVVLGVLRIGMFPFALRKGDFKLKDEDACVADVGIKYGKIVEGKIVAGVTTCFPSSISKKKSRI